MAADGVLSGHRLVAMANQIASNVPNREAVAQQLVQHIEQFWTPPMRQELRDLAATNPELFDTAVLSAVALTQDKDP